MSSTFLKQVQAHTRSRNKGGSNSLKFILGAIERMFTDESRNEWTPMAWLIAKSDYKDAAMYRRIVGRCTGGLALVKNGKEAAKQPSGMHIKVGDNFGPTEHLATLRDLVAEGESIGGKAVLEQLFAQEAKAWDKAKKLEAARKYYTKLLNEFEEHDVSPTELTNMVKSINLNAKA